MMNDNDLNRTADPRTGHARAVAIALLGGLAVVAALGAGLLLGGAGNAPETIARAGAPSSGVPGVPTTATAVEPAAVVPPTVVTAPTSAPATAVAPENLYAPTGADTEAAGLVAAEAGLIGRPTLVWFHAHWCHVCQEIRPEVEALAREYGDRVALVTMNVDHADTQAPAARYQVSGTPTFVLFAADGRLLDRFAGWIGRPAMASLLDEAAGAQ
jgi:thiol-disulfide isomerase/thioredoxin